MYWLKYFINEIAGFGLFMGTIVGALALILACAALNFVVFSDLARIRRAEKAQNKFFKTNTHINRYNRALFNKSVVKKLPKKPRRMWIESAVFYQNYCSDAFETSLHQASKHGGNATFVTYVFSYIAALVLMLLALIAVGDESYVSALVVCAGIFGGAIGLLLLAVELYYLDKSSEKKAVSIINGLRSREINTSPSRLKTVTALKNNNKTFTEAAEKKIANPTQKAAEAFAPNVSQEAVAPSGSFDSASGSAISEVICLDSKSADDFDELKSIEDKANTVKIAVIESGTAAPDAKKHVYDVVDVKECFNIDNIIGYENSIAKGASPIGSTGIAVNAEEEKDSLSALENLINSLINDGSSDRLLSEVHDALLAVSKHEYSSAIDSLRLKCLLKRLETAI